MLLLRVLSGSRLYGTSRPDSDWDYIEVHDKFDNRQPGQVISDGIDVLRFGMSRFLFLCESGFPRALEAMFAPDTATQVDVVRAYRHAFRPNVSAATATYTRVIDAFEADASERKRLHAVRLRQNLDELHRRGRFDPVQRPETTRFDTIRWT